ncbi:hypothetical protein LSM04_002656 [Trypanosoma melophagium]|uniref:uncharacterized protein n=1 Tax=Trypanosoma melophagium TaxID=715481 RepID=UPI00351A224E|nr:hypothetical protein LSM04_002656 [Trypanosoma melophagium]
MKEKRCQCVDDVFADVQLTSSSTTGNSKNINDSNGGLRVREFHVGLIRLPPDTPQAAGDSFLFLQQDWCHAFRVGRMNYWHERLEDHLIEEPEVFQYQIFAMEFPSHSHDFTAAASGKVSPLLCQLVLSTERLYVVPRHDAKLLSLELPLPHPEMRSRWFTAAALESISIDFNKGIIVCIGRQQQHQQEKRGDSAAVKSTAATMSTNSSGAGAAAGGGGGGGEKGVNLTLGFFDTAESEEAVLEIQLVWESTHRNDEFPMV